MQYTERKKIETMLQMNEWIVPDGEPEFTVDGIKWQYVKMHRTDGTTAEGYYRFGHDLVYKDFRAPYGDLAT